MFPAARIGDPITHDMLVPSGVIGPPIPVPCPMCAAQPVMIEGLPAAHVTCSAICSGATSAGPLHPPPPPPAPPPPIVKGSLSVFIHNMPAARWSPAPDLGACGVFLGDPKLAAARTVLIGDVGAGGVAGTRGDTAATGSAGAAGPPSLSGTNGPFASQDEAARAALQGANPVSIRDNLEYAGLIYRDANGDFYYTGPIQGTDQGANPSNAPAPPGTTVVGDYHTHGDYSVVDPTTGAAVRTSDPARDDFNSDNFSTTDKAGIAADAAGTPGYAGYLGTPSGTFKKYDPATGNVSTL